MCRAAPNFMRQLEFPKGRRLTHGQENLNFQHFLSTFPDGAKNFDLQLVKPYQHFLSFLRGAKSFDLQLVNPYQHFFMEQRALTYSS
ncbi:hypothetical protein V6N12_069070 [Hibiscus sabdariffa]|uniref:Uncharacterized protein n=1 Tax=Hibiscus sabdariffa TaxID=183260 RepID=A0ABR2FCV0_9ROSI